MFFAMVVLTCGHFAIQENTDGVWIILHDHSWKVRESVDGAQDAARLPHRKQDSPHNEDDHVLNVTSVQAERQCY